MTPLLVLLGLAGPLAGALTYATFCYISPFGPCRRCRQLLDPAVFLQVRHKRVGWLNRATCRRCDGTGHRIRIGIRAWQAWRRTWRDAHRAYPNPTSTTTPSTDRGTSRTSEGSDR